MTAVTKQHDQATYRATTMTDLLPVDEPGRHRASIGSHFDYQRAVWVLKPIAFILALVVVAGVFYVVFVPGPTSKPTVGEYLMPLGTVAPEPLEQMASPSPTEIPTPPSPTPEVTWTPPTPAPAPVVRRTAPQWIVIPQAPASDSYTTGSTSTTVTTTDMPDVDAPTPTARTPERQQQRHSRPHRVPTPTVNRETVENPPALITIGSWP